MAFARRLVALACILGLFLPMLPAAFQAAPQQPSAAVAAGYDMAAPLALSRAGSDQPAMLAKLLSLDSGDAKRFAGDGKPPPHVPTAFAVSWDLLADAGGRIEPPVRVVDAGISRGPRSPTGPPSATA